MKKLGMWSEFILLVFIIIQAEASLPGDDPVKINFTIHNNSNNTLLCDHVYGEIYQNKYTVLEGEPFIIFTKYEKLINHLICHDYTDKYIVFNYNIKKTRRIETTFPGVKIMGTLWNCTILTLRDIPVMQPRVPFGRSTYAAAYCFMKIHVRRKEAPQTILVNNMVVPAVREDQAEKYVDFTAEYHYVDGDMVNVTCINLLNEDKAPLTMEYEMAGIKSDTSTVRDISSSTMIGFIAKLHAGHNNSYMICTYTGPKDYTKVMIRFVMLTEPNIVSISINGMTLRPRLVSLAKRHYEIKYKLVSHQPMNLTCEVERTGVKLLMLDDDFGRTERTKTEPIPNKKTELSFYLNPGDNKSLACSVDYVKGGGLVESVFIEFTTATFPTDIYSQVHMELPPSGTVMELYSYKDYKLSVILYELKQNETLHLTCGPVPLRRGPAPVLYLQLNNTEICKTDGCNVSTTLQHVSQEHVHPPIVCSLKEAHEPELPSTTIDPVYKEIRVILLHRALAVTEPSSTTLSTTLTADIFTNNTAAEPPSSETVTDSSNNNTLAYWLIAAGIAIVIIIIVVIVIKKRSCVRSGLPIPAPRLDPASVFYENLLSVFKPINEREAAALQETQYEEIPLGDLTNINSNRNKSDNQNDHLPNDDTHHYTEIDYAQCKPKGTEAPHKNNYIYDEPYPH